MDEPVPVRRAAVGCLVLAIGAIVLALLVRPAIFSVAPPRDDSAVTVGTSTEIASGPRIREVVLARAHGWDGERPAGDGRVQLALVLAPSRFGGFSAVAAASPVEPDCALEVGADRLVDCAGRAWTFEGVPLDSAHPPLDRFPVSVEDGSVRVDLTRTIEG